MKNDPRSIKDMVKDSYAKAVKSSSSCCSSGCCCGGAPSAKETSKAVGYSEQELETAPDKANLGFGCGNPTAIASIKEGETVIDLGSGAGLDAFLAAGKVGPSGKVIGVDMTPEMIDIAKKNAIEGGYENVEFRQGEIEKLPVEDGTADLIISNCVINLSPEKEKVFAEAYRALRTGGRLMVSDLVLKKALPEDVKRSPELYASCVSGAVQKDEYLALMSAAGFKDVELVKETEYADMEEYVTSISVSARK